VPYVAVWSEEQTLPTWVIQRGRVGIGYADETPYDRDRNGVSWSRFSSRPGAGRPEYVQMHPLRQRRAMRRLLCQVCAQPADQTDEGCLWLLSDRWRDWKGWPEGAFNPFPPVCVGCAVLSTRLCPPLRRGHVAVRAHSTVHGVIGVQFQAGQQFPAVEQSEDDSERPVALQNPAIRWTLATLLTRALHHCTPVDLDQLSDNYRRNMRSRR
jgi:hypothetical protein